MAAPEGRRGVAGAVRPLALETGVAADLGFCALDSAARDLAAFRTAGAIAPDASVAVNLTTAAREHLEVAAERERTLVRHEHSPRDVVLEVAVVARGEEIARTLRALIETGHPRGDPRPRRRSRHPRQPAGHAGPDPGGRPLVRARPRELTDRPGDHARPTCSASWAATPGRGGSGPLPQTAPRCWPTPRSVASTDARRLVVGVPAVCIKAP